MAEGTPAEQELAQRALEDGMIYCDLRIVSDGREALDYLHRRNGYADPKQAPRPDLLLLDLNMPQVDGKEVLREVKANSQFAAIPIIVRTTSRHDEDVVRSYELGCNPFISKPGEIDAFVETVRALGQHWFQLVALPAHEA